jgi:hypothetical protein
MVAECAGVASNAVRVIFLWTPSRSGTQWLDLSIFNNGFAPGSFVTTGGLAPQTWGFVDGYRRATTSRESTR